MKWLAGLALVAGMTLGLPLSTANATTSPSTLPIDWTVNASTHLAKLNQTVTVPPGTFVGSINLSTGHLEGNLSLPPATTTIRLAGLVPLATATFAITEAAPITGQVNFSTFNVSAVASFNIHVVRATPLGPPLGLPVNLVGNECQTSVPVTVKMAGKASLTGPSTFQSTYTIPPLAHCGLATVALNLLVAGGGNTFTATFAPKP